MKAKQFRLVDFIKGEEKFFLSRACVHSRQDLSMHRHDYAEVFWVEDGSGHHLINDRKVPLQPGHLVMIRPDDAHTFISRQGITIMNLAFPLSTLQNLRKRYFNDNAAYFWIKDALPFQTQMTPANIRLLSKMAGEIWPHRHSVLYLDSFLLFLFKQLQQNAGSAINDQVPAWLNNAIHEYASPAMFRKGAAGFATLSGKHIDHVNRMIRKCFGKTLSDLVTELRMDFAARQLMLTNAPIKTICHDCGFTNLSHFYKTFRSLYQQTPARYRESRQTIV